jgi:succinate dehydrogenase flavin-adding protein (antitoxin of CptAB toxin-antitoxin module)
MSLHFCLKGEDEANLLAHFAKGLHTEINDVETKEWERLLPTESQHLSRIFWKDIEPKREASSKLIAFELQ